MNLEVFAGRARRWPGEGRGGVRIRPASYSCHRGLPSPCCCFQGFGEDVDGHCDTIIAVAEVIKLTDPSLLYLEVSTLVSKYPDIR